MYEYTANFHQHTNHSDGEWPHERVIDAGRRAGLDVMAFTDHNIYVPDKEGWHNDILVIMGIEVNDMNLVPEHNHMLCIGIDEDLNDYATDSQALIDVVQKKKAVSFIAHPFERDPHYMDLGTYPWRNWAVTGYTGLEIWNYMTEFKSYVTSNTNAIRASLSPDTFISGPFEETLAHWDELTKSGQKVTAIGGSDAHGKTYRLGPISRVVFPYEHLFKAVRTHLLLKEPLSPDFETAKEQVLACLRKGHCFVAYDQIGDTTGFEFTASNSDGKILFSPTNIEPEAMQGDEIILNDLKLLEIDVKVPARAEIRLLKNGVTLAKRRGTSLNYLASTPGVYRVECYRVHKTKWRGWIFSNPIYVKGSN